MRVSYALLLTLGLAAAGCGEAKKENSAEQAPADQPAVAPEAKDTTQAEANAAPLPPGVQSFGARITEEGAHPIEHLPKLMEKDDSVRVKLTGKIADVCQVKGCWMDLPTADGKTMKVRFKDYAFFVPKDAKDKTTVVEGWAYRYTVPVDELRHYAEDAGKSKAEIAAITKPEQAVAFEAEGVLIKQ